MLVRSISARCRWCVEVARASKQNIRSSQRQLEREIQELSRQETQTQAEIKRLVKVSSREHAHGIDRA